MSALSSSISYALGLETPPVARCTVHATFGAGGETQRTIVELSAVADGHFQPPKVAMSVSLSALRALSTSGDRLKFVGGGTIN